jgi:hypothetical protein
MLGLGLEERLSPSGGGQGEEETEVSLKPQTGCWIRSLKSLIEFEEEV